MLKIVFLISVLVGLSSGQLLPKPGVCGIVPATSSFITYGNKTKIGEYPWTVMFRYYNATSITLCGGSLINERYVVTAGHCVEREIGFEPFVRLGELDITKNPDCEQNERNQTFCAPNAVNVKVENIIVHPQYENKKITEKNVTRLVKLIHDIALLRLARPVSYTKYVSPICLPVEPELSSATFEGIEMDVVGWGRTELNRTSPVKLKATVKVINVAECKNAYSTEFDDSAICAGGFKGVNSCGGDSGGPLLGIHKTNANSSHYFLAGVVSFGKTNCTLEGYPGVYTRVGEYIDWIKENVRP